MCTVFNLIMGFFPPPYGIILNLINEYKAKHNNCIIYYMLF